MHSANKANSAGMASDTASPSSGSQSENLGRMLREIRELANDHIELITLETRFSINTVLRMAIITIVLAIALAGGLLALLGAAALALISAGLAPALAMLLVATINFLLAFAFWFRVRQMSRWLGWPATQRAIQPPAAVEADRPVS
jgi:hypothetical protein